MLRLTQHSLNVASPMKYTDNFDRSFDGSVENDVISEAIDHAGSKTLKRWIRKLATRTHSGRLSELAKLVLCRSKKTVGGGGIVEGDVRGNFSQVASGFWSLPHRRRH